MRTIILLKDAKFHWLGTHRSQLKPSPVNFDSNFWTFIAEKATRFDGSGSLWNRLPQRIEIGWRLQVGALIAGVLIIQWNLRMTVTEGMQKGDRHSQVLSVKLVSMRSGLAFFLISLWLNFYLIYNVCTCTLYTHVYMCINIHMYMCIGDAQISTALIRIQPYILELWSWISDFCVRFVVILGRDSQVRCLQGNQHAWPLTADCRWPQFTGLGHIEANGETQGKQNCWPPFTDGRHSQVAANTGSTVHTYVL